MPKKLTRPFEAKKEERKQEDHPLSPVIHGIGRLEANSLCAACRSNDFAALLSRSERYIPDQTGYQCTLRTVDHISQH
jgi:hypothetical protein